MTVLLSNPDLPGEKTAELVASDPDQLQQLTQAAMFRPPLSDQARARRVGGLFLLLTRKALSAMAVSPGATLRMRIASTFVSEARELLNRLRSLEIDRDPGFTRMAARIRERLAQIRMLVPVMHDAVGVLQLIEAELLALTGDLALAHAVLEPLFLSIRSMQGQDLRDEIAIRYFDLCISRMDSRAGFLALLEHLARRLPSGSLTARFGRQIRLIAAHTDCLREIGLGRSGLVFQAWNKLAQVSPRRLSAPAADMAMQRLGVAIVRHELGLSAQLANAERAIRAMGGLGDLLMMTPGLRALSKRIGRPVEFAVPRRFLALFEANPFVAALGIEDLSPDWYRAGPVIDLTDCPASAIESRSAPKVRINRIEIFARALGISVREMRQHGLRPVFEPSAAGRLRAEEWLESRGLQPGGFIAIQAAPAEGYRTWNGMPKAARALAETMPVVVFDDKPIKGQARLKLSHENVALAVGLDLATSLALACEAKVILAPDSAFFHLAGARAIPSVGVFGPTDGALRASAYPESVIMSRAAELHCVPCWRNQGTPCMLTGGMTSQCLESLPEAPVVEAVTRLLVAAGQRGPMLNRPPEG